MNSYRHRKRNSAGPTIKSVCEDITVKGSIKQIIVKWKELAQEAETCGNWVLAERMYQQAEHYVREDLKYLKNGIQKDLQNGIQ